MDGGDPHITDGLFIDVPGLPADLDPRTYAEKVLSFDEHADIRDGNAIVDWLFRRTEKRKLGRRVLGMCYRPTVQGDLKDLFDDMLMAKFGRFPDFLIVLDWNYWIDATERQREILVHHELMHARQALDIFGTPRFDRDGNPVWDLRPHDLEEFNSSVRRYGVHSEDVETFLQAVADHMEA